MRETKPSFIIKPRRCFVDEGKTAKFKASVDGEPPPSVTWSRGGNDIANGGRYKVSHTMEYKASNPYTHIPYVNIIPYPLSVIHYNTNLALKLLRKDPDLDTDTHRMWESSLWKPFVNDYFCYMWLSFSQMLFTCL